MLKTVLIVSTFFFLTSGNEDSFQTFVQANKLFAADAYKQFSKQTQKNILICPFSAEIILSLAQNGAKGKTQKEIQRALHLQNVSAEINDVFQSLLPRLRSNTSYTLQTANRIYLKEQFVVKEKFGKIGTEVYGSTIQNVDFTQPQIAAGVINEWVSQQTKDKIQDLINPDSLNQDTVAVLVNALYLQAAWRKNFKKTLTREMDFYTSKNKTVKVEMMKKHDYFGYYEDEELDAKFLQMQFRDGRNSSMVVVLPNKKEGLKTVEKKIDKVFNPEFSWEYVEVALPKFKIESSVDFKRILKKLGVKKAFRKADFSGISGEPGEIYISDVVQKTFIEINENGVEASSSTAVLYHPKSLMEFFGDKKTFVADHPFLFYIVVDNIVIFTGRMVFPS